MTLFITKKQGKNIPIQKLVKIKDGLNKYTDDLRNQVQKKQKERDWQQEDMQNMEDNKNIKNIKRFLL